MTCSTHNAVYRPRIFILYGVFFSVFTKGKRNTWTFLLGRGHFILPGWAEPCFSLFFSRLCDPHSEPITASPAFPSCVSRTSIPTSLPVLYKIVCVRFEIDVQQLSMSWDPAGSVNPCSPSPPSHSLSVLSHSLCLCRFFLLLRLCQTSTLHSPLLPRLLLETNSLATSCSVSLKR